LIAPADPTLRHWLHAEGSLTARLRQFGPVEVRVQQQGAMALWGPEQHDLQQRSGYVREVVLLLGGRPAVWARSATSQRAIQGPWRAMQGLATRPLAELLFSSRRVERAPLQSLHLPKGSPLHRHMRSQWLSLDAPTSAAELPHWARSSVFRRHGHALRVMEAFAPWVCTLKQASL